MIINRPGRKFVSAQGNSYIKVLVDGKYTNVMLDEEVVGNWDTIKTLEIGAVTYDKSTVNGELVDVPMTRNEVIDFQTITREFALAEHSVKLDNLRKSVESPALTSAQVALAANAL